MASDRNIVSAWTRIGTVVGNTSTGQYSFILQSLKARVGDIVATRVQVPTGESSGSRQVLVWGRIQSIDRFNPFFPHEAAQELAEESISFLDTVLSNSRDQLQAEVLILGASEDGGGTVSLSPLTYPVQPAADVLYPPATEIRALLTGAIKKGPPIHIGTLIARRDVDVSLAADRVVSRHLAILAMTGGGKTVAARRIIRELIGLKYPLIIFDPHGDYLGLYEKQDLFPETDIKLFYPVIKNVSQSTDVIYTLITKLGIKLSPPQLEFLNWLMNAVEYKPSMTVKTYIQSMGSVAAKAVSKQFRDGNPDLEQIRGATVNVVKRSLVQVGQTLTQMELNNEALRRKLPKYTFAELPDVRNDPEQLVRPGQVSILYLAGYDHLTQSAIVSIVLEALFYHRASLSNRIAPFQAVVEEAHNFIPSRSEGTDDTPSLPTIRKVITEGRKFGTGLVLISQRPSRLDETTLAQCNSFLVLRLVNPSDQRYVRQVMENLSEADARLLPTFGEGQGIVSGQAVRFPLLVQVKFDEELVSESVGDENFIARAQEWQAGPEVAAKEATSEKIKALQQLNKR
jgi:DNA helicase HerA-like ATPase